MAFEDIKDSIEDIKTHSEHYIRSNVEYVRLWGLKVTAKTSVVIMTLFLVGLFLMLSLFFISIAVAFALTELTNSLTLGFLYVGLAYLVLTVLAYNFRKYIVERPLIKKLSEIILND